MSQSIAQTPFFNPKDFPLTTKLKNTLPKPIHYITLYIPLAITALVETIIRLFEKRIKKFEQPLTPICNSKGLSFSSWKNVLVIFSGISVFSLVSIFSSLTLQTEEEFLLPTKESPIEKNLLSPSQLPYLAAIIGIGVFCCYYFKKRGFSFSKTKEIFSKIDTANKTPTKKLLLNNSSMSYTENLTSELCTISTQEYSKNQNEAASILLDQGAQINPQGKSLLFNASTKGNYSFMKFLLEKGASVEYTDPFGFTALHNISLNPYSKEQCEIAQDLLDKAVDPLKKNDLEMSSLHFACFHGNLELVKIFHTKLLHTKDAFLKSLLEKNKDELIDRMKKGAIEKKALENYDNYLEIYKILFKPTKNDLNKFKTELRSYFDEKI